LKPIADRGDEIVALWKEQERRKLMAAKAEAEKQLKALETKRNNAFLYVRMSMMRKRTQMAVFTQVKAVFRVQKADVAEVVDATDLKLRV